MKLLRVLEEQEFYPVGSSQVVKVDVRIIASTNKSLKEMVEQEKFRQDLRFRLDVFRIKIPPLRERTEDILSLAEYFIEHYSRKAGKKAPQISKEAEEQLLNHTWRGNCSRIAQCYCEYRAL